MMHFVLTDISKSGKDNINYCKDDFQLKNLGEWLKTSYCSLMGHRDIRYIRECNVIVTPSPLMGIDYRGLSLEDFFKKLQKDGCKVYARFVVKYNLNEFNGGELTEEQKACLDVLEKVEFVVASGYDGTADRTENLDKDLASYAYNLEYAYRYDKATRSIVAVSIN
jgi:hypothetical protein